MFLFHFLKFFCYIPFVIAFPCKVVGRKNMPKGGAVIVCNHTSNIDALQMAAHFRETNYYLAKKELFSSKFMSFVYRHIGAISIDRSTNDVGAIKKCLKVLKDGRKLVIFPEGTRVHNENMELGEIKGGAAMLAVKTRVPVVPIYINKRARLFRRIKMTIGQPFELAEFYEGRLDSTRQEQAGEILADKMNALRMAVIESDSKSAKQKKREGKKANKKGKKAAKIQA